MKKFISFQNLAFLGQLLGSTLLPFPIASIAKHLTINNFIVSTYDLNAEFLKLEHKPDNYRIYKIIREKVNRHYSPVYNYGQ